MVCFLDEHAVIKSIGEFTQGLDPLPPQFGFSVPGPTSEFKLPGIRPPQVSENANCDGYESTSMVQPVARIRPFQVSDDKDVRFAIGKGSLESLAVANRKSQQNLFPFLFSYKKWEFQPTSIL